MTLFHYRESCRYENTVSLLLTYFSQSKLLLHWRGRLARVNFKECPKTAFGLPVMGVFQKSCEFRACGRKPWRLSEAARGRQLVMGSLHTHTIDSHVPWIPCATRWATIRLWQEVHSVPRMGLETHVSLVKANMVCWRKTTMIISEKSKVFWLSSLIHQHYMKLHKLHERANCHSVIHTQFTRICTHILILYIDIRIVKIQLHILST